MAGQLSPPRLVRTAHTSNGSSVFASDDTIVPFTPFGPAGSGFSVFDVRNTVPVINTDPIPSFANVLPRTPAEGVTFTVSDIPGNGYSVPMHRTLSLDYSVVLSGEIALELDSGEERTIRAGEFIVQQGTNHKWVNRCADPCRILFVMVGAQRITLEDGRTLEETVLR